MVYFRVSHDSERSAFPGHGILSPLEIAADELSHKLTIRQIRAKSNRSQGGNRSQLAYRNSRMSYS